MTVYEQTITDYGTKTVQRTGKHPSRPEKVLFAAITIIKKLQIYMLAILIFSCQYGQNSKESEKNDISVQAQLSEETVSSIKQNIESLKKENDSLKRILMHEEDFSIYAVQDSSFSFDQILKFDTLTEDLDLSNLGLSQLPDSLKFLKALKRINLSNNNFKEFPEELFNMKKLMYIDLSNSFKYDQYNLDKSDDMLWHDDEFLIQLTKKFNHLSNLIITFSNYVIVLNSDYPNKSDYPINACESPKEFKSLLNRLYPKIQAHLIMLESDYVTSLQYDHNKPRMRAAKFITIEDIHSRNLKTNVVIYQIGNGVTIREWCLILSIGQSFTLKNVPGYDSVKFEKTIRESQWIKLGKEDVLRYEEMWNNSREIYKNNKGDKIISVSRGGC